MVFRVKNLEKGYHCKPILKDISFQIPRNKVTVILGKNGAGKTTLIKLMLGMMIPDKGKVLFEGTEVAKIGHAYYQQVSAVLESVDNVYPFLTGRQNIEYFLGLSQKPLHYLSESVQDWIDQFEMREAMNELVGGYSRGMLQKLSLIMTLMTNTQVLFLDEPTLGLDFQSSKQLCHQIKHLATSQSKTIILTSHQSDIIELLADYVIMIDEGMVVYRGDYQDFLEQAPHTQEYEAVLSGEVSNLELGFRIEKGKSYLKRSSLEELISVLEGKFLMDRVIKMEKVNPTIEETLLYFYNRGIENE